MIITIAYTGLRWGEAIGLETEYAHSGEIPVEWQLRELRSAFHRLPPKDDSYRSPAWEPCLPVDLPPFLADLLNRQVQGQPRNPCACATQHGGTGRYVFLGPDGGHYRRSTMPGVCSAPPVTGGLNRHPPGRHGWSSPTPRSGPVSRSPCGRSPTPAPSPSLHHEEEA